MTGFEVDAWFSPRIVYVGADETTSVVSYCRVCGSEVTRRMYVKATDEELATRKDELLAGRKADSAVDGEEFLRHLRTQHPGKWSGGDA